MILPICTYNCEVWGASFFPKHLSPADFLSEKQCKNPLDRLHCSFSIHIFCVYSRTSNLAVRSETNRTSIVPLILKRMVRCRNRVKKCPSPIIQDTLELSKQLHKEVKTSWFTSIVKISELIHNSTEPCFDSQIELKRRLSKTILNAWYTKRNLYSQGKLKLYTSLKGCVRYIFASLFFKPKREHLWNLEKCFLFHFKSSCHSRENQALEF